MAKLCYACLNAPGVTKAHVPPKSFFPKPCPQNLITVDCCREYNNGNSGNDDFVRTVLSSLISRSSAGARIWEQKVVPGFMPLNPRAVDFLLASMVDTELVVDGLAHDAVAFDPGLERMIGYFIRLTKGLLRHHYPAYDYAESTFSVRFLQPWDEELRDLVEVREMLVYNQIGDGVFQYRHRLTQSEQSGLWMLVFYEAILVLVHHSNLPTEF